MNRSKESANIVLLSAYFGKLPGWIDLFLESCRYNPTVNWVIIADDDFPGNIPDNVLFAPADLSSIKRLVSETLKINARIDKPYKMCDIKPSYGLIFDTYIRNYEFWGHIDLDLIFGDIGKFITAEMRKKYDIISADTKRICGPFTIYKNCEKINTLFFKCADWKEVFESPKHFGFDEIGFDRFIREISHNVGIQCFYGDFQHYGKKRVPAFWTDGKLYIRPTHLESMFIHLRPFKKTMDTFPALGTERNSGWKITKRGFQPISPGKSTKILKLVKPFV